MGNHFTFKPGSKFRVSDFDPADTLGLKKEEALAEVAANTPVIDDLSHRLYAENRRALLLVLQGMDTSGKDGAIRHVMTGVNPQTCQVVSFKQPSEEELDHDFLWRVHRQVPRKGNIGIFNRSHYEDVLVVRVHQLVPEAVWKRRYEQINAFEELLVDQGTTVLKMFLHISRDEQRQRLVERLRDPRARWKFSRQDLAERALWSDYQEAYEDALTRCNTDSAPWHVIPANRKWVRNLVISRLLRQTLEKLDPQYPQVDPGIKESEIV